MKSLFKSRSQKQLLDGLKNQLRLLLVLQLIWNSHPALAISTSNSEVQNGVQKEITIYDVDGDLVMQLAHSQPGSVFYWKQGNQVYETYFFRMGNPQNFEPCTTPGPSCIPLAEVVKPVPQVKDRPTIIQPGEPGYPQIPKKQGSQNNLPSGQTAETNSTNTHSAQGSKASQNGNRSAGNDSTGSDSQKSPLPKVGGEILKSALVAGAIAGVSATIINEMAAKYLQAANKQLYQSKAKFEQQNQALFESYARAGKIGLDLAEQVKVFENLSLAIPEASLSEYKVGTSPDYESKISIPDLEKATQDFDPAFGNRVLNVGERINRAPEKNAEVYRESKQLGKSAVKASVENQAQGLFDISEAQLKIAEQIADFLYGIDPITAIHRGVYEISTGRNLITGKPMSALARGLSGANAALSILSSGIIPAAGRAAKAVVMIARSSIADIKIFNEVAHSAEVFTKAAVAAGVTTKSEIRAADLILKKEIKSGNLKAAEESYQVLENAMTENRMRNPISSESDSLIAKLEEHEARLKQGGGGNQALSESAAKIGEKLKGFVDFKLAPRVLDQLNDPRLGSLAGKLDEVKLNQLLNSPNAQRFLDANSGHINIVQTVDDKLLRITVTREEFKIISVGPIKPNGITNGIENARFIPLK